MKIESMLDFSRAIEVIPESVAVDVQGRILDHILGGGSVEDTYIKQQFKYVEKVIRKAKKKQFTQRTLNKLLDEIIDEYFSDEEYDGLWNVIECVEYEYREEIATLPN